MCGERKETQAKDSPGPCCSCPQEMVERFLSDPKFRDRMTAFMSAMGKGFPCPPPSGEPEKG